MTSAMAGLMDLKLRWTHARGDVRVVGMVYFLARADGAVKIGCTGDYRRRRDDLLARHGPLTLVHWELGYYDREQELHRQFASLRIDPIAEWFYPGEDLIDFILLNLALR